MASKDLGGKLDELIDGIEVSGFNRAANTYTGEKEGGSLPPRQAKQAIKQLFLDVIGPDEPDLSEFVESGFTGAVVSDDDAQQRNKLRAELREAVKKL